jgi:hypothetical protein
MPPPCRPPLDKFIGSLLVEMSYNVKAPFSTKGHCSETEF